ncbi:RidA family protein [Pedobacter sp. MC2016-05]|uniref:RidA family protein n=1 Tax=Pedobacter sp. MC2016-05 TaxID=2994474 RepID=UPI002247C373|nr:RidA family protein [Pedobacter sp. MC2016-05]MCX2474847.1 RidA family protein [Pedobacter sp. MC2016-05]
MKNENFEIKSPEGLYDPKPHGYSHMATVNSNSKMVFIAGQGGSNMDGVLSDDFKVQVDIVFENIEIALKSEGLLWSDVVKLTTLVVDYDSSKHEVLIAVSQKIWPDLKFPVNTLIPVSRLALDGMQIEIDVTAVGR